MRLEKGSSGLLIQKRLVDPETRNILCSQAGGTLLRDKWEQSSEEGSHNLQFKEWVENHSLWLNELKVQSTTPLILRDEDDRGDNDCEEGSIQPCCSNAYSATRLKSEKFEASGSKQIE